jgi:hypothetical protein
VNKITGLLSTVIWSWELCILDNTGTNLSPKHILNFSWHSPILVTRLRGILKFMTVFLPISLMVILNSCLSQCIATLSSVLKEHSHVTQDLDPQQHHC